MEQSPGCLRFHCPFLFVSYSCQSVGRSLPLLHDSVSAANYPGLFATSIAVLPQPGGKPGQTPSTEPDPASTTFGRPAKQTRKLTVVPTGIHHGIASAFGFPRSAPVHHASTPG